MYALMQLKLLVASVQKMVKRDACEHGITLPRGRREYVRVGSSAASMRLF